jgi:hypothetical protein
MRYFGISFLRISTTLQVKSFSTKFIVVIKLYQVYLSLNFNPRKSVVV